MADATASMVLAATNAVVAYLNLATWYETGESRDITATVAWIGSTAYWLVRGIVALMA